MQASYPTAMNDPGQVVGEIHWNTQFYAFLWTPGGTEMAFPRIHS